MACSFCGSGSHERESCPWYGTGSRVLVAVALVVAVGCTPVKNGQAVAPISLDPWSRNVKETMVLCGKAVAEVTDMLRGRGVEVTGPMMDKAYGQCLRDQGVMI